MASLSTAIMSDPRESNMVTGDSKDYELDFCERTQASGGKEGGPSSNSGGHLFEASDLANSLQTKLQIGKQTAYEDWRSGEGQDFSNESFCVDKYDIQPEDKSPLAYYKRTLEELPERRSTDSEATTIVDEERKPTGNVYLAEAPKTPTTGAKPARSHLIKEPYVKLQDNIFPSYGGLTGHSLLENDAELTTFYYIKALEVLIILIGFHIIRLEENKRLETLAGEQELASQEWEAEAASLKEKTIQKEEELQERDTEINPLATRVMELRARVKTPAEESTPARSIKFPDPPWLSDGKEPRFDDWIILMNAKLKANQDHYSTPDLHMTYVQSGTEGKALQHLVSRQQAKSEGYNDESEMLEHLKSIYHDPNRTIIAKNKFRNLQIKKDDKFHMFLSEFLYIASEAGIHDEDMKEELYQRLPRKLQEMTVAKSTKDTYSFGKFSEYCSTMANSLEIMNYKAAGTDYAPDCNPDDDSHDLYGAYMTEVVDPIGQLDEPFTCPEPFIVTSCYHCHRAFPSNNELHNHLGKCMDRFLDAYAADAGIPNKVQVYESDVKPDVDSDRHVANIRSWRCTTARVTLGQLSAELDLKEICLDTGCSSTIIDEVFAKAILNMAIRDVKPPITVRGIGKASYKSTKAAVFDLYFPNSYGGKISSFAKMTIVAYLVPELRLNTLIDFATAYHISSASVPEDRESNWSDIEDFEHVENADIDGHVEVENLGQSLPGRRYRHLAAKALRKAAKTTSSFAYCRAVEKALARAYLLGDESDVYTKAASDQTVLPNGVTIYGIDPDVIDRFRQVVERYDVWASPEEASGTVNIPEDQWIQVPIKEGQEIFQVAIMGFVNSVPYVQRIMDNSLEDLSFCRAYIDDIVNASKTLDEYIEHFSSLFERLESMNVKLEPKNAFLGFPSVTLLGQRVDSLGLSTPDEKMAAIRELSFPSTLTDPEHYLGLTGYFRHYIAKYASIMEPLQARKTAMLKGNPKSGQESKNWSRKALDNPTDPERDAFDKFQARFVDPLFLCHFDPERQLYVDLDAFREGYGIVAYYAKVGYEYTDLSKPPLRRVVEPILSLSCTLTAAERNYSPAELEIFCLVWTLRKIRHLNESSKLIPVVYTDHSLAVDNVVADTLSRLPVKRSVENGSRQDLDTIDISTADVTGFRAVSEDRPESFLSVLNELMLATTFLSLPSSFPRTLNGGFEPPTLTTQGRSVTNRSAPETSRTLCKTELFPLD
ncbi:uncharacterized protein KD926_007464 [Aspergillus affinis]|uniref:uncharacterized protein n=1 Tax=Aspergillus affinis TaxID=1070780 RepID=UPI0022FEC452|nr:uncharacterized protein KD926_007464 [Aspergillus affinis]KAI9041047.1 hypothetical protein KD926_007464 [Aspergillus affinis]